MDSIYHKAFITLLIISTLIILLLVDDINSHKYLANPSIINESYQTLSLHTNSYCEYREGILDRIVDGKQAVILIEELGEQIVVPIGELPMGSEEQTWFNIEEYSDGFTIMSINESKTNRRAIKSEQVMEKLRKEKQDELPRD